MKQKLLEKVICGSGDPLHLALKKMAAANNFGLPAGIVLVCDENDRLIAVATDGDVRRGLLEGVGLDDPVARIMKSNPITFPDSMSYSSILREIPKAIDRSHRYRGGVVEKVILVDQEGRPTRLLNFYDLWEHQIARHRHVVVLGLGYVGLTLAVVLAELGYRVTGVEQDAEVIASLRAGEPHFHEVGLSSVLQEVLKDGFSVGDVLPDDGDVFIIAVGTPINESLEPDLGYVRSAASDVGTRLRPGALVVVRSTVPVGTTRNVVLTELEETAGLAGGTDFHLACAPERTVEGDALRELGELPQIIGGLTPNCLDIASALFATVAPAVVRVDSLEEAELAKIVNNGFRDVSFAFANQIAQICSHYDIDPHELIRAANYGYQRNPLPQPSPGVGGVCLRKDPYILAHVARSVGIEDPIGLLGREINESMPPAVVGWMEEALDRAGKRLEDSTILLAGMAFKGQPETSDLRASVSVDILEKLQPRCGHIRIHDPAVPLKDLETLGHPVVSIEDGFEGADLAAFLTNHPHFSRLELMPLLESMNRPAVVFDGWGILDRELLVNADGVIYQGLGFTR